MIFRLIGLFNSSIRINRKAWMLTQAPLFSSKIRSRINHYIPSSLSRASLDELHSPFV